MLLSTGLLYPLSTGDVYQTLCEQLQQGPVTVPRLPSQKQLNHALSGRPSVVDLSKIQVCRQMQCWTATAALLLCRSLQCMLTALHHMLEGTRQQPNKSDALHKPQGSTRTRSASPTAVDLHPAGPLTTQHNHQTLHAGLVSEPRLNLG